LAAHDLQPVAVLSGDRNFPGRWSRWRSGAACSLPPALEEGFPVERRRGSHTAMGRQLLGAGTALPDGD
jgi:hypothetical protein